MTETSPKRRQDKPVARVLREFMREYVAEHEAPNEVKETEHATPKLTGTGNKPK